MDPSKFRHKARPLAGNTFLQFSPFTSGFTREKAISGALKKELHRNETKS
jgi:hypothetical protein